MYDGPNYNPPDVQRHAKGQPPWVQAQAKVTDDAAAWQAHQEEQKRREASGGNYTGEAWDDQVREMRATVVYFVLGGGWLARYFRNRILRDRRPS